jgi:hypothetical protein
MALRFRKVFAVLAVLWGVAAMGSGADAKAASGAPSSKVGDSDPLRECVQRESSLSVLFLVDVSSSLFYGNRQPGQGSDPDGLRANALQAVVELLHTFSGDAAEQGKRSIEVAFADFGQSVRSSFPAKAGWLSLDDFYADGAGLDELAGFKMKRADDDTDYVGALWSQASNDSGAAAGDDPAARGAIPLLREASSECRALVWLTDGNFEFGGKTRTVTWSSAIRPAQNPQAAADEGKKYLCQSDPRLGSGPLVDELRDESNPVFVAAVGLGNKDFSLLKGIAEGDSCGKKRALGRFVNAGEPQDLLRDLTHALIPPQLEPQPGGCARDGSKRNPNSYFVLNESVERLNLIVSAKTEGTDLALAHEMSDGTISRIQLMRDGVLVTEPAGAAGLEKLTARDVFGSTAGGTTYILVKATTKSESPEWLGRWFIEFCRDSGPDQSDGSSVYVYGGMSASLKSEKLFADRSDSVEVQLYSRLGSSSLQDPAAFVFLNGQAKIGDKDFSVQVREDGTAQIPFKPTSGDIGKPISFSFEVIPAFKLSPNNKNLVELEPVKLRQELNVLAVPKTPLVIDKAGSAWGRLTKNNLSAKKSFVVKAGEESGKVCFGPLSEATQVPTEFKGQPKIAFSPPLPADGCITMKRDAKDREIALTVSVTKEQLQVERNASVVFENVTYEASTDVLGDKVPGNLGRQTIPFESAREIQLSIWKALLASLVALGLPLALLWGYNYFVGAQLLIPNQGLYGYSKKFILGPNGLRLADSSLGNKDFVPGDLKLLPVPSGKVKRFDFAGLEISGSTAASPFSAPFVKASAPSPKQVIGPTGADPKTGAGFADLAMEQAWFLQVDASDPQAESSTERQVDLVVFTSSARNAERAVKDAIRKAPQKWRDLENGRVVELRPEKAKKANDSGDKETPPETPPSVPPPLISSPPPGPSEPRLVEPEGKPRGRFGRKAKGFDSSANDPNAGGSQNRLI